MRTVDIDKVLPIDTVYPYVSLVSLLPTLSPYYDKKKLDERVKDLSMTIRVRSKWVPCEVSTDSRGHSLSVQNYNWAISDSLCNKINHFIVKQFGICPFVITVDDRAVPDTTSQRWVDHTVKAYFADASAKWLSAQNEIATIRPAFGYDAIPDHRYKRDVFNLLQVDWASLTETCSIVPETSICGLIIPTLCQHE